MAGMAIPSGAQDGAIRMAGNAVGLENLKVERSGSNLVVDMDLRLDDLKLPSNVRFVFTPLVKGSGNVRRMSPVVVNGRRQQISYERFARKDFAGSPVVVRRRNGKGADGTLHRCVALRKLDGERQRRVGRGPLRVWGFAGPEHGCVAAVAQLPHGLHPPAG